MTNRMSPGIDDGFGYGGGRRPWWDFPTPLGTPKQQIPYGTCYVDVGVGTGSETFKQPTPCGLWWPWSEHQLEGN